MDKHDFINDYLQGKHPIEQETWKLPTEGELDRDEALYDALLAEKKVKRHRTLPMVLRWLTTGIAASILLLLVFRFGQEPIEEQPVLPYGQAQAEVAEAVEQPAPQPPAEEKKAEPQKAYKTYKTHKSYKPPVPEALAEVKPSPSMEKSEEDVPTIPADKQALADIFLAEEALQVAFELRARQEAIRAYAASLTGRELPKPIIAF